MRPRIGTLGFGVASQIENLNIPLPDGFALKLFMHRHSLTPDRPAPVTMGALTATTVDWVVPHYVLSAREELTGSSGERRLEILRGMVRDLAWLRRGDLSAERLELQREELELKRVNSAVEKEKEFRRWLERPEIQKELYPNREGGLSPETIEEIEKALNLM